MGRKKIPRGRRKKRKKARTRRIGAGLKHHLGAIDPDAELGAVDLGAKLGANIYGAKLGARIYGAKLPAKSSPRLRRAQDLGAKIYGAETCKLGATNDGAELRVQILKALIQGHICEFFFKKGVKKQDQAMRKG